MLKLFELWLRWYKKKNWEPLLKYRQRINKDNVVANKPHMVATQDITGSKHRKKKKKIKSCLSQLIYLSVTVERFIRFHLIKYPSTFIASEIKR